MCNAGLPRKDDTSMGRFYGNLLNLHLYKAGFPTFYVPMQTIPCINQRILDFDKDSSFVRLNVQCTFMGYSLYSVHL